MLIFKYESKKVLRENIGKELRFTETSIFGSEYKSNGVLVGSNRPHLTGFGREFFAQVTLENDIITEVK